MCESSRACPGHPRLSCLREAKTWMPGTRPGMTSFAIASCPGYRCAHPGYDRLDAMYGEYVQPKRNLLSIPAGAKSTYRSILVLVESVLTPPVISDDHSLPRFCRNAFRAKTACLQFAS